MRWIAIWGSTPLHSTNKSNNELKTEDNEKSDNSNPLPAGVFGKGLRRDEGDGELRIELSPGEGSERPGKKIRSLAVQRGGFELVTAPASEVVHDADNMMRQHFENGWMWEGDKNTGVLELKDEKGDVVERIENALLTDIKTVQEKVEAMCCATM